MSLREKILAVMADMNEQMVEREELIEVIAITLLTRKDLSILGAPRQIKSFAINQFRARIIGARQFERLLTKRIDEDQLFGRVDLASLTLGEVSQAVLEQDLYYRELQTYLTDAMEQFQQQDGDTDAAEALQAVQEQLSSYTKTLGQLHAGTPCVNTTDKTSEADIIMLDEIFKCSDGVLNPLPTVLNERKYANEDRTYSIPAVFFPAASNEVPNFNDPQEKILEAFYDRLDLRVMTADIAERDNRLATLRKKQSGTTGNIATTITLDELKAMQREATALPVPDSVHELADDILRVLRENGIRVFDRKYLNYAPVAQAKAWLSSHAAVMPEDLLVLKNHLWDVPQDWETVEQTLRCVRTNPIQDKANSISVVALKAQDEFDEIRTGSDDPNAGRKVFTKLRGGLTRLYGMWQQPATPTQGPNKAAVMDKLLEELEQSGRQAHEAVGFTYIPLKQQAALQRSFTSE